MKNQLACVIENLTTSKWVFYDCVENEGSFQDDSFLFELSISCITEENYWIEYSIGIFKSRENIDTVIKRIMSKDGKVFDSDCEVHISEIEVIGEGVDIESVYRFWGQNRDKSLEGDIVESPCYIDKRTAIQELLKAKKNTPRQQWKLENYVIGKCDW